ncbi:MAG: hypothetical protein KF865_04610 [Bdellovibrionaceae bacterium]|nr:hypothetical protein [Pseudobdellovibrionaceae bacterium]
MSLSFELEIKSLLDAPLSPDETAERLMSSVESDEDGLLAVDLVVPLARFLLHAGLYSKLILFVMRHWSKPEFPVPWPYFLEAIALSRSGISGALAEALIRGIDETRGRAEASRSRALDPHLPANKQERADRRLKMIKNFQQEKEEMLEQLVTLRTQQLYEQEKRLLEKLQRMFPTDGDVRKEAREHKERYALEILARHNRLSPSARFDDLAREPGEEKFLLAFVDALRVAAAAHADLIPDFAVAAAMVERWEDALGLLALSEDDGASTQWLRLELLLAARRHLELLQELARVEVTQAPDPEAFFATAYLRAQALWGLGQKHTAIEVMESLLAARPQYRSGHSLLNAWRGHQ